MARIASKKLNRKIGGDVFILVILILVGGFMLLPFIYAILQSFKPMEEIFLFPPRFFVNRPTTENFYQLTQLVANSWVPFTRYIFNSLLVSIIATAAHVIIASMAAYPLAKATFPGSRTFFQVVVLSLLFTTEVTALPRTSVMSTLHMIGHLFRPDSAGHRLVPPGRFLMKQFISVLPDSMIEAVKVDGAGTFRTYWSIVMPNVKPAWMTCIIFAFQSIWNYEGTQFIYDESLKVLPTMFRQISEGGISRVGVGAAAAVLLMIPPILIFTFSQSQVIETMAQSGLKE